MDGRVILISLISLTTFTKAESSSACGTELKDYLGCLIDAERYNLPKPPETIGRKELEDGLKACFATNGCQSPSLDDNGASKVGSSALSVNGFGADAAEQCLKAAKATVKAATEHCSSSKLSGFTFPDEKDQLAKPDFTVALSASFWVYSVSEQLRNASVCPGGAKLEAVKTCCSAMFGKVYPVECKNPFDALQDSAQRYESFCAARQNCTKRLSTACRSVLADSVSVVRDCAVKEYQNHSLLAYDFTDCLKKADARNDLSLKAAEMFVDSAVSGFVAAVSRVSEKVCERSFFDQFNPQARNSPPQRPPNPLPPNSPLPSPSIGRANVQQPIPQTTNLVNFHN